MGKRIAATKSRVDLENRRTAFVNDRLKADYAAHACEVFSDPPAKRTQFGAPFGDALLDFPCPHLHPAMRNDTAGPASFVEEHIDGVFGADQQLLDNQWLGLRPGQCIDRSRYRNGSSRAAMTRLDHGGPLPSCGGSTHFIQGRGSRSRQARLFQRNGSRQLVPRDRNEVRRADRNPGSDSGKRL